MPIIYDNGANLTDTDGQKLEARAMKQEDAIEAFFCANPGRHFTAWEIYHVLNEQHLIGSVRRAMTNMTNDGILTKCPDIKKPGDAGVDVCTWTLTLGQASLFE